MWRYSLVRAKDDVGEMAPVRRIRERLRFERHSAMRAVMRAAQPRNRTIQLGGVVDLDAGLGAVQFQGEAVLRRAQRRYARQAVGAGRRAATKLVS